MDLNKMKSPITAAQAMAHPAVFETVNSLGQMADELCAEVDALTKERDKLAEQVSLLKTTNEVLAEKLAAAETAHLYIRTQSLNDAASLCESQAEQLTYPSTGNAIALVCARTHAAITQAAIIFEPIGASVGP